MSAITATTEKPAGNAARVRLRLLAAFLPVTAALYVGAEALDPRGTDQVVTNTAAALRLLPIAAAHSSQLYLSGAPVGAGARRPGGVVCGDRHAGHRARLGHRHDRRGAGRPGRVRRGRVQRPGRDRPRGRGLGAHDPDSGRPVPGDPLRFQAAQVAEYVYFVSEYTAPFVMGYALWRSRRVPRWLAVLFTVGLLLAESRAPSAPRSCCSCCRSPSR